jgi:hypothetical protein
VRDRTLSLQVSLLGRFGRSAASEGAVDSSGLHVRLAAHARDTCAD